MKKIIEGPHKCAMCGEVKQKLLKHFIKTKGTYVDENGKKWEGKACPSCHLKKKSQRDRFRGALPYGETSEHTSSLGRRSEQSVKEFFEQLGHKVTVVGWKGGPDLTCELDGKKWTVEVKSITTSKYGQFIVSKVYKNRINDDFIAMVYDKIILIEPMKEHLKECNLSGMRALTQKYGKILRGGRHVGCAEYSKKNAS